MTTFKLPAFQPRHSPLHKIIIILMEPPSHHRHAASVVPAAVTPMEHKRIVTQTCTISLTLAETISVFKHRVTVPSLPGGYWSSRSKFPPLSRQLLTQRCTVHSPYAAYISRQIPRGVSLSHKVKVDRMGIVM